MRRSNHSDGLDERKRPYSIRGLRWWIVTLLFAATLINFLNRLAVAVLGPVITVQLGLNNEQFATLTSSFLLAYMLSQGVSGALYDKVGSRRGFMFSVIIWSIASCFHAIARSFANLSALRFALGIGEGGMWPGAAKVIAEWIPARERALAMGICNSGSAIGTALATPLIIWMELHYGWRSTFLVLGGIGFFWLVLWYLFFKLPREHPNLSEQELTFIKSGAAAPVQRQISWLALFGHRHTWAILLARFFGDPIWWLYITWLPLYLARVEHFSLQKIALFGWLPFLAADIGSLLGGWLSGHLISRGWTASRSRKSVIFASSLLMCSGLLLASSSSAYSFLTISGVVLFGFQSWIGNVQTLISDQFPVETVASVMGLSGMAAGFGAMLLTQLTGIVVDRYSYTPILIVAGILPIIATMAIFLLGDSVGRSKGKHDSLSRLAGFQESA